MILEFFQRTNKYFLHGIYFPSQVKNYKHDFDHQQNCHNENSHQSKKNNIKIVIYNQWKLIVNTEY